MGNLTSVPNEENVKQNEIINENIKKDEMNLNEEEIFSKIWEISNNLLIEYNNEFLKEDFCNKIAIIYEKKLSKFNIKLLKNLYNNINSENIDNEMILTLQYLPKNDDEFFTDIFKDNLNEKFWNEKIEFDPQFLLNNIKDVNINNIKSSIKYLPYYINPSHVNNLLKSINKINDELKPKNNNELKTGGGNGQFTSKSLNNYFRNENNEKVIRQEYVSPQNNRSSGNNRSNENSKNNRTNGNNRSSVSNGSIRNNRISGNNRSSVSNGNIRNNRISVSNGSIGNNRSNGEVKEYVFPNPSNIVKEINRSRNNEKIIEKQNIPPNSRVSEINRSRNNGKIIEKQNIPQNVTTSTKEITSLNKNKIVSEEVQPPKNSSIQKINEVANTLIAKNLNISSEKNIDDKIINEHIKYYVPKNYQKPTPFCNNMEKCKLSKKDLCTAITQNFIVRNNIIAAILTTVPYKNSEGLYEGGICFQKFMNLNNCNVCVPYDYRELKNKNIKNILTKILEKADNLDENRCRENQGYYLKLNDNEKKILTNKILNISEKDINNYPKIKYNYYFIEFTKKLQNSYLQNLNSLISILEKIKETSIINNATLNLISTETKKIINNMYNTCHYYYVYAIISLISADINEDVVKEDPLANIVSSAALDKK